MPALADGDRGQTPQLALSPQDAQAPECILVHDPSAPWDQVYTLENVVPAPTTVGQPPRKDPQMEYSKIVPQSEQTYRNVHRVAI
ncbi:hypothetical protein Tco_0202794 [Tanacetum coccineum]